VQVVGEVPPVLLELLKYRVSVSAAQIVFDGEDATRSLDTSPDVFENRIAFFALLRD
jgi:hypothetical protein